MLCGPWQGWGASDGGNLEPPNVATPMATMTRDVWPNRLVGPETTQTVKVTITFLSEVEEGVNPGFGIGTPTDIGVDDLVTSEVVVQYPVPGWDIVSSGPRNAGWATTADRIEVGVPYEFVVELRAVKSASLIGTPRWKPQADMSAGVILSDSPPVVGNVVSVAHPDGVSVTAESQEPVAWQATATRGTELHFWPVVSPVEPCGAGVWCVVPESYRVPVDIKPGGSSNPINVNSNGTIPVAILAGPDLDPMSQLVMESLTFGRTGFEESLSHCGAHGEDVNGDGRLDLVCHFRARDTGLQAGSVVAWLVGESIFGDQVWGGERIRVVGGGKG